MPRSSDGRWKATCEVCGKEFTQSRPGARTCSRTCGNRLPHNTGGTQPKAGLQLRACQNPECGRTYQPVRESQVACSKECLLKAPSYIEAQRRTDMRPERQQVKNERRNLATTSDLEYRRFFNFRTNLRRNHGQDITIGEYQMWAAQQDGYCKICGKSAEGKNAHTDHDHETGRLRGLLCQKCNQGLGCFGDDPELLFEAAAYIERYRVIADV